MCEHRSHILVQSWKHVHAQTKDTINESHVRLWVTCCVVSGHKRTRSTGEHYRPGGGRQGSEDEDDVENKNTPKSETHGGEFKFHTPRCLQTGKNLRIEETFGWQCWKKRSWSHEGVVNFSPPLLPEGLPYKGPMLFIVNLPTPPGQKQVSHQ